MFLLFGAPFSVMFMNMTSIGSGLVMVVTIAATLVVQRWSLPIACGIGIVGIAVSTVWTYYIWSVG